VKFLCEQCKAKYQIADEKAAGKTVRMKCRKCGYLIEVRAAATEPGVSSLPPAAGASGPRIPTAVVSRPAPRPAPPRAPLATSLASAKSPAKPAGPLASALKSALQREEREGEVSAPIDMSDLSPSDEWYVAINGVPVGPIRIGEVRRKAALGAVTEESLCWQEGLDEWRALRSFPDLAALVREASASARASLTPSPPEGRASHPPTARPSLRPSAPAAHSAPPGTPPRAPPARPAPPSAASSARSNVVPFTSRLATAEKLEVADDRPRPFTSPFATPAAPFQPTVVPDPFALPSRPVLAPLAPEPSRTSVPVLATVSPSVPSGALVFPAPAKKSPPWMAIAMIAAATAFGVTAALALFMRPAVAPIPAGPVAGASSSVAAATPPPASASSPELPEPTATSTSTPPPRGPTASGGVARPAVSATAPPAPTGHGPLDLHSLTGPIIAPTEDPGGGNEAPKAPGQCMSQGQVQQVIAAHQIGVRRACWERNTTQKASVNVAVSLTIGPDGSAQGVSTSGDEASVASCIASDVRNWRFAALGCSQPTAFSFHFVRQ
jgi:predicted Zn finger-like uncharacterized protein